MKLTPIFLIVAQASPPAVLLSLAPIAPVAAQLTPDNTLGAESSVVTPDGPTGDRINGGAARGSNLFHSFSEFNVEGGRSVYFYNPQGIENILTRVTGGNVSNINGRLGVLGEANLFLVNPNGIIFGPDASLDINGSFYATTGEGIKLGENGLFSATDLDPSVLLHVRPSALFHNALINHMATLNNQANLAVPKGESLVLHGEKVTHSGSLTAPGGTVMVLGESIGLLNDALIDVSDSKGGGNVFIGGFLQGRGNMGTATRTYIGPDATISSDALETGDGGRVIVWAEEITGFYGNISAQGGRNGGDGGFVEVSGGSRLIFRGEVDTTAARGNPGTLLLDPRNIIIANGQAEMEISDADESIASEIFNGSDTAEDVTIYESQLEGLSGQTNLVLQATNDIVVADLADDSLNLARGTGDIAFIADADRDGVGDFSMADPADTINTNGRNIAITAASLTLGNIDTSDTSIILPDGAGDERETAAIVSTGPGETLSSISGNLFGGADVDLYQIYITGDGTFSATTIDETKVDTQLFLFDTEGLGLYGNNDNFLGGCNCFQSILSGEVPLTPTASGIYYLGINVSGVNPVSDDGEIFRETARGNILQPTGAGGALPLSSWENVRGDDRGDYTIALTGVEATTATFEEVLIGNTVLSNSGAIALTATQGNITAGDLNAASLSGAAGEIRLDAAADIRLDGSRVDASGVVGGGGEITLHSGGEVELNNSFLNSSTNGVGDAGKVAIAARDTVRFSGGGASSKINSEGLGDGGGIEITTGTLEVADGAELNANSSGEGDAGKVFINATGRVFLGRESSTGGRSGARSQVLPNAVGNSGGIEIAAGTLEITDGARLAAGTFSVGNAGKISINATGSLSLGGESSSGRRSGIFSIVQSSAVGNGGGIEITAGTLELTDGAALFSNTFGEGDAGKIFINATGRVSFRGESSSRRASGAESHVFPSGVGNAEGIEITAGTLELTDGAHISASTDGVGDANIIRIEADESINISGIDSTGNSSGLFAATTADAQGEAGDIIVSTQVLNLRSAAVIDARTENDSTGGDIEINTNRLEVRGGSQILSSSLGRGNAGTIEIEARELVTIAGTDPNYNSRVASFAEFVTEFIFLGEEEIDTTGPESGILSSALSTGNGGSIILKTDNLQVSSGALLSVSSAEGVAGSLNLTADTLSMNNGTISAETASGNSGNITIDSAVIVLQNSSKITTNATGNATGGNISIATENMVARNNSDISANAIDGRGGNISITASGLFLDLDSQITATSESGIDGTVEINNEVDPASGLVQLDNNPLDPEKIIAQNFCVLAKESSFIITGRGGIAINPGDYLTGEGTQVGLVDPVIEENSTLTGSRPPKNRESDVKTDEIRQAQGWVQLPDGTIVLTSYPVIPTPHGPLLQHPGCSTVSNDRSITVEE